MLGVDCALVGHGLVGVSRFLHDATSTLDVLEGVGRQAAVAAVVVEVASAVYQLLLANVLELAVLLEVVRLQGAYSGESPATAALALVFNGRNDSFGPPVPGVRDVVSEEFREFRPLVSGGAVLLGLDEVKVVLELALSHVGVGVEAFLVCSTRHGVVLDNFRYFSSEDALAVEVGSSVVVDRRESLVDLVFSDVLAEHLVDGGSRDWFKAGEDVLEVSVDVGKCEGGEEE